MSRSLVTGGIYIIFTDGENEVVPVCWNCQRRGIRIDPEAECGDCKEKYFRSAQCTEAGAYLQWPSAQAIKDLRVRLFQESEEPMKANETEETTCAMSKTLNNVTLDGSQALDDDTPIPRLTSLENSSEDGTVKEWTDLLCINTESDEEHNEVPNLHNPAEGIDAEPIIQDAVVLDTEGHARTQQWLETNFQNVSLETMSCSDGTDLQSELMDLASVSMDGEAESCVVKTINGENDIVWKPRSIDCLDRPKIKYQRADLLSNACQRTICKNEIVSAGSSQQSLCSRKWSTCENVSTAIIWAESKSNALCTRVGTHVVASVGVGSTDVWVLPATPYRSMLPRLSRAELELRKFVKKVWGMTYPYVPEYVMDFIEDNREEWLHCWVVEEIKKKRISLHKEHHPHFIKEMVRLTHNWQIGRNVRKHVVMYMDPNGYERLKSVRVTLLDGRKAEKPDPDHYEL